jgi:hypothetical protein
MEGDDVSRYQYESATASWNEAGRRTGIGRGHWSANCFAFSVRPSARLLCAGLAPPVALLPVVRVELAAPVAPAVLAGLANSDLAARSAGLVVGSVRLVGSAARPGRDAVACFAVLLG